jgi:cysteine desulfurase/selenocysteine lyase
VKYAHEKRLARSIRCALSARAGQGAGCLVRNEGRAPHDIATMIDRSGVAVRAGTHCVMPLLARFGVTATCRASFAMYNTKAEVDILAASLMKAQEFFA